MCHGHVAKILKQMAFCILFYWVNISNFHKSILYSQESHESIFAMNRMSLCGILILHVKHSWSVSPVIPDLAYRIASLSLIPSDSEYDWLASTLKRCYSKAESMQYQGKWREWFSHFRKNYAEDKPKLPSFPDVSLGTIIHF